MKPTPRPFLVSLRPASFLLLCQLAAACALAAPIDPFSTAAQVSALGSRSLGMSDGGLCDATARPEGALTLARAIEFALCNNPSTKRDWAAAKIQAAQVGLAKSAYLPQLTGSGNYQREKDQTRVKEDPTYDRDIDSTLRSGRVDLSMVLFDFGARAANLANARELLNAANATHDATLQTVFINAAQSYYDALTARSSLVAIQSSKYLAEQSFLAAEARFKIGLGNVVEKLQAETAFAQESLKLVKAEGNMQVASGNLASVMGFAANTPLQLDTADEGQLPEIGFMKSVEALMEDAKARHPSLLAARSQVRAARAGEDAARASGLPVISFTANTNRASQPSLQLGLPPLTTATRSTQIGVQINIPLFDGYARTYRIRQASAQAEVKEAELAEAELQVSLGVWRSYQALQTATEELKVADKFRFSANKSVDASRSRYKAGATEVLELLNAQSVLANADQQGIQALADWRTARLRLAYSLGLLGALRLP